MEVWQSPVYCTCLENRRTEMFREFESHRFRHIKTLCVTTMDNSKLAKVDQCKNLP